MSNKIETRFLVPALFFALLLSFASRSASAEELIMGTITADVAGTNEILDGDYLTGASKSKKYVDAGSNVRRVAARTNLCVAFTATQKYDKAVKWCDAAVEVGRQSWITKNNRAVLAYLMGDLEGSKQWMAEAQEAAAGYWFPAKLNHNDQVIELKIAEIENKDKVESFAQVIVN